MRTHILFTLLVLSFFLTVPASAQTIEQLEENARSGDKVALYKLGKAYYDGYITPQDYQKAFYYFTKADAFMKLGDMYLEGRGVDEDHKKALELYKKAANFLSFYSAGTVYEKYFNDPEKAFKYYLKSAKDNYMQAQFKVSDMYENGYGTAKNLKKAKKWYDKAREEELKREALRNRSPEEYGYCGMWYYMKEKEEAEAAAKISSNILREQGKYCGQWYMNKQKEEDKKSLLKNCGYYDLWYNNRKTEGNNESIK